MIRFVTGNTGGGKSTFASSEFIEEVVRRNRPIVTNCAIKLDPWVDGNGDAWPGLLATLEKDYGDTFNARRRIYFLKNDQEIRDFFLCRPCVPLDPEEPVQIKWMPRPEGDHPRFVFDGSKYSNVCYFIEEGHEYFAAEDWKDFQGLGQSWASQNRRAGDDCWVITQHAELIAKGFRRQAIECIWMVNHAHRNIFFWRQPEVISYRVYLHTPPVPSEPAMRSGVLHFNRKRIWGCFDTTSGGSVKGQTADIGRKAKGLPAWTAPIVFLFVLVLCGLAFSGCQSALKTYVNRTFFGSKQFVRVPGVTSNRVTQASVTTQAVTRIPVTTNFAVVGYGPALVKKREVQWATNSLRVFGWGQAGNEYFLDTDGGTVRGTNFQERGSRYYLDGEVYERGKRVPLGK